jgi:hypothetical protein
MTCALSTQKKTTEELAKIDAEIQQLQKRKSELEEATTDKTKRRD